MITKWAGKIKEMDHKAGIMEYRGSGKMTEQEYKITDLIKVICIQERKCVE
jgi:hypothetical protein